ncbi:MAG: (deoxy)nucleoside triphosphate pyrophosphohydrolase [Kineosporiaceae bacterium]
MPPAPPADPVPQPSSRPEAGPAAGAAAAARPDVIRVVAAALVDDLQAPRLLLAARRTEPEFLAGGWELPGGKVDPGESDEQALRRELLEELGVEVRLGAALPGPGADGAWPIAGPYRLWVRWAQVEAGEPQPLEGHDELRWLARPQWSQLPWLSTNVAIVAALERAAEARDTTSGM